MPRNIHLLQASLFVGFILLSFKIHSLICSLWGLVLKKYMMLMNIACIPLRHWIVILPVSILLIYISYLVYLSIDSSQHRYRGLDMNKDRSNWSHLWMVPPDLNDRDCVCIDKRLCYKGYYDDAYIKCVSKSLPKVINVNA